MHSGLVRSVASSSSRWSLVGGLVGASSVASSVALSVAVSSLVGGRRDNAFCGLIIFHWGPPPLKPLASFVESTKDSGKSEHHNRSVVAASDQLLYSCMCVLDSRCPFGSVVCCNIKPEHFSPLGGGSRPYEYVRP